MCTVNIRNHKNFRRKGGVVLVELLLAFALWVIFLVGIAGLWFLLFNSDSLIDRYIDMTNLYADTLSGENGIDWNDLFGKRSCESVSSGKFKIAPSTSPRLDGQSVATAMKIRGNLLYLSANSATSSDADFYIYDMKNPLAPQLLSKLDTGPGIVDLNLRGYSAEVANTSINAQLQVIDISSSNNPRLSWAFKVPGSHGTTTSLGTSVISDGPHIYFGTEKSVLSELYVIDSISHQITATYEVSAGINNLYISKGLLYMVTPLDPELSILDVSKLPSIKMIAQYDAPGTTGNGKSIEIKNDSVYVGRTVGGNELIQLSRPKYEDLSVSTTTSLAITFETKIGATVDDMIASRDYLFILTNNSTKEFQVWRRNASSLTLVQTIDLPARAVNLGCTKQGSIVVALGTNDPLLVLEPTL